MTELKARQNILNENGVMKLIYRLLKSEGIGHMYTEALGLGIAMMEGGNRECQMTLLSYASHVDAKDSNGHFFKHLSENFREASDW